MLQIERLCDAIAKNDVEAVKECLKQNPSVDVNTCVKYASWTLPLAHAVSAFPAQPDSPEEAKQLQIMGLLLEHKADPNATGENQHCALHFATTPKITEFILDAKASVDAVTDQGWSALMCATYHGRPGAVRVLLEHGADPELQHNYGSAAADINHGVSAEGRKCKELLYEAIEEKKRTRGVTSMTTTETEAKTKTSAETAIDETAAMSESKSTPGSKAKKKKKNVTTKVHSHTHAHT